MITINELKLELSALFATAIIIAKTWQQISAPRTVKCIHFGFVAIFSIIGIGGARFVLMFILAHHRFIELFSQPNVLGIGSGFMQLLTIIFAMGGSVLFVASMRIAGSRKWARKTFCYIVCPCSVLYPIIMLTAIGDGEQKPIVTYLTILFFLTMSVCAILFYRLKSVAKVKELW